MTLYTLEVYGDPLPGGSKRAIPRGGRASVVDANPRVQLWKDQVSRAARDYLDLVVGSEGFPLEVPLSVHFFFMIRPPVSCDRTWPSVRPDLTKLIRPVEDALTGILWKDDALIVEQYASKRYSPVPCVIIDVERFEPSLVRTGHD